MKHYHFSKTVAKRYETVLLFEVLIALIEVQRLANLYRANTKSKLTVYGICDNVDAVRNGDYSVSLPALFFKSTSYPIVPYSVDVWGSEKQNQQHRWGNNKIGNRRMQMLALMIKDLTNYLQAEA